MRDTHSKCKLVMYFHTCAHVDLRTPIVNSYMTKWKCASQRAHWSANLQHKHGMKWFHQSKWIHIPETILMDKMTINWESLNAAASYNRPYVMRIACATKQNKQGGKCFGKAGRAFTTSYSIPNMNYLPGALTQPKFVVTLIFQSCVSPCNLTG